MIIKKTFTLTVTKFYITVIWTYLPADSKYREIGKLDASEKNIAAYNMTVN